MHLNYLLLFQKTPGVEPNYDPLIPQLDCFLKSLNKCIVVAFRIVHYVVRAHHDRLVRAFSSDDSVFS